MEEILALVIAYLLGSIPFAFIVAQLRSKIDITQVGTRNVGTMNVARELDYCPDLLSWDWIWQRVVWQSLLPNGLEYQCGGCFSPDSW